METKKIARIGLFIAIAFVLGYVEAMIPINLGVPGIKLGLPNLVILICLYECSVKDTFLVSLVRILLSGLTFGSLSTMLYSLAGGVLSLVLMALLKKSEYFSVYGVSIAGGVSHNIGQIIVAIFVLQTGLLIYYLPFLLLAGSIAGIAIGFVAAKLQKRIHPIFLE